MFREPMVSTMNESDGMCLPDIEFYHKIMCGKTQCRA